MEKKLRELWDRLDLFFTHPLCWVAVSLADLALSLIIIRFVAYTEIDWKAYMQEIEGPFVHDDWDYMNLRGDTGPLVYPAGFVYFFAGLRLLTDNGTNILRAQYIFACFHSLLVFFMLGTVYYRKGPRASVAWWVGPLLVISRRVHSIFALRLFNDGVAMLLMYMSTFVLVRQHWTIGVVFFSLAFSIKMNIILFAPGLAVILLETGGLVQSLFRGVVFISIQVLLALPFLFSNAPGYLHRAFELGRVFMFKWTVNFKFLPEEVFVSPELAIALLALNLVLWVAFGQKHFAASHKNGLFGLIWGSLTSPNRTFLDTSKLGDELTHHIILTLFISNFIGIVCARSIHYQFYCWYYHQLGYLTHASMHIIPGIVLIVLIEICYNIYPATPMSSGLLQAMHITLLACLWMSKPIDTLTEIKQKKNKRI